MLHLNLNNQQLRPLTNFWMAEGGNRTARTREVENIDNQIPIVDEEPNLTKIFDSTKTGGKYHGTSGHS